ncbi:putative secreted protein (Por secretion system target) [Christiangramia gaetbulicola]|uniref:Putative secreted protein (Por secretion system target) n=1 Tax=Christiangramia gaetbulicola TaxID=703340 RepID=A0A2T6AIV2_9FLAO|nr:HYR domain-containing protein [Christiangramia gaetbulicola]PTX43743.1 putative secreted protein (Por secretion system target) [Christiangramia gaetbulicola]
MISTSCISFFRISSVREIGFLVLIYFSFLGFAFGQNPADVVPSYSHSGEVSLPTVTVNILTFSVNTDDITFAIDTGPDNFVYNLTFGNGIQKRNPNGSLVNSSFITGLSSPLDFVIDDNGFFYVADYSENGTCAQNGKIRVFNPNGTLNRTIYTGFYRPLGVDVDSDGNIYVAEYNAPGSGCESDEFSRVSIYNSSGNRIAQNGLVDRPYRIAVSSDKTVYLSQEGNNNPAVLIMNQNLGITGSLPNIQSAGSVVVDSFDYIHVVEYAGRIDFSRFINFEDLSFGEIQDIAEEIDKGTKDNAFGIKVFNPLEGYEYTYKEEIDFPIDISFNQCDKMYVDNAEVFGRPSFFGYIPEKIEFDLEIYDRTPAFDITDPVINCPADITVQAEPGDNSAIVNYNDATATDLCGVTVTKSGQDSGSQFMVGEHEVKFTATDTFGNTSICTLKITVNPSNENAPPTITCPSDITQNNDPDACGAVVTFSPPEVTDDGGEITPTRSDNTGLNSGDLFPVGVTNISYQADDGVNAPVTCSFTITITDNEDPVISCPGNINESIAFGETGKIINYSMPGISDNCGDPSIIQTSGLAPGEDFPVGTTTNTFVVDDGNGNSAICSFTVTITEEEEDTPPTITCPANITQNNDLGACGAIVTFSPPEVTDDGGEITPTRTDNTGLNSGDLFPEGTTTISYQADDGVNAPVTCSFTVIITDNEDPVISCPGNINESIAFGETGKIINYSMPSISDYCGDPSIIQTSGLAPGEVFPVGTTTNTFVVNDGNGNSATCSFTVTITEEEENTPPTITCPVNIAKNNDPGVCGAVVTFSPPEVTDDGGEITPTRTDNTGLNSGDQFPIGETTISYQADDGVNNPVTCSFTVTITDDEKPIFTSCPSETIVIFVQNGETGAVFEAPPIEATDNCGDPNVVQTRGPEGGAMLPLGFTDFEYTATDVNGLTATCEFQVEVREESEVLDITCPGSVPVPAGENCIYLVPDLSDVVSANIAGASITQDIAAGSVFDPNSDPYVTVTATIGEQSDSCRIYLSPVDEVDPVARCVGVTEIRLAEGETVQLNPQDFDAGSTDNCQIASYNLDRTSLSSSDEGVNRITFTVNDAVGNLDTCEVIVEVIVEEPGEIDFSCLIVEYKLSPDENCEYFLPDFSGILEYSPAEADFEQSVAPGTQLFQDEEVEVIVSYNGESKICNLYVSLVEDEPQAICKADFQIQVEEGETVVLSPEDIDNGSFANCSDISLSLDKTEFTTEDIGTNLVTLTVTDESGNTTSCQTTVTVISGGSGVNQPPVAIDEEYTTNINTTLEVSASNGVLVNDTDPENDELTAILQDDVSNGTLVLNADGSFTYTPDLDFTGQDYFTYVANDGEFNSNIIFVSINVENNDGDFSCTDRITLSLDSEGSAELDINDLYTGNAEGIEFELSQSLFSCSDIGENTAELVYTGRQEGACEIIVEVLDMSAPVLALKDIEISLNQAGLATITFNDLDAGSRDNCNGDVTYILSGSAFTCKDIGENQILVTAEDSSGNSSTRTAKVTVLDNAGYCTDFGEGSEYIFIYPNPNTGSFKIATPADEQITRIEVFDHRGRFIAARDYESTAIEYAMKLGPLQESVYVVKIVTNQRTLTKRFIFKY